MRPFLPKDRSQAAGLYCDLGTMSVSMYAFTGDTSKEVVDESREVHCRNASLSEQDFDEVRGASARAETSSSIDVTYSATHNGHLHGFRLTIPN